MDFKTWKQQYALVPPSLLGVERYLKSWCEDERREAYELMFQHVYKTLSLWHRLPLENQWVGLPLPCTRADRGLGLCLEPQIKGEHGPMVSFYWNNTWFMDLFFNVELHEEERVTEACPLLVNGQNCSQPKTCTRGLHAQYPQYISPQVAKVLMDAFVREAPGHPQVGDNWTTLRLLMVMLHLSLDPKLSRWKREDLPLPTHWLRSSEAFVHVVEAITRRTLKQPVEELAYYILEKLECHFANRFRSNDMEVSSSTKRSRSPVSSSNSVATTSPVSKKHHSPSSHNVSTDSSPPHSKPTYSPPPRSKPTYSPPPRSRSRHSPPVAPRKLLASKKRSDHRSASEPARSTHHLSSKNKTQ